MEPSAMSKTIAKYLNKQCGGKAKVHIYRNDDKTLEWPIFSVEDVPQNGVTTYSTVGLSETDIGRSSDGKRLRVELIMATRSDFTKGGNILFSCADEIQSARVNPEPGTVIRNVVAAYAPKSEMRHALLVSPFLWDIESQSFESVIVAWLHAVPISTEECLYTLEHGFDAIDNLFEEEEIDVYNINRRSVL